MKKEIYSPKQAAEFISVKKTHILRLINSGKLAASNIGLGDRSVWRISHDEIESFLNKRNTKQNEQ